jgi:hypothetical protein
LIPRRPFSLLHQQRPIMPRVFLAREVVLQSYRIDGAGMTNSQLSYYFVLLKARHFCPNI